MHTVSFSDWLELLGLTDAIDALLAGIATLPDTIETVSDAKTHWPSVSQDFASVLDQLGTLFDDVADAIAEQTDSIESFNAAVGEFGESFAPPGDRLLTLDDLQQMSDIRASILERLAEAQSEMERALDDAEDLLEELDGLQGGMDEDDPFLAEDIERATDELNDLQDQLKDSGCLA